LGSPYGYVDPTTWTADYQNKTRYLQSLSPTLHLYWPINRVNGSDTYSNDEAQYATESTNAQGYIGGFGSQGLSLLDVTTCGTGTSASNWCYLFGQYYKQGMPLELQQISISDETVGTCTTMICGVPPKVSGDLRAWLPYAVNNHATVIEMYYHDLGLAFDPNFCTSINSSCQCVGYTTQTSTQTEVQNATWFNDVGQPASCTSSCGTMSCGAGHGGYATAIQNAHGVQ
jgi:hypothetical protein